MHKGLQSYPWPRIGALSRQPPFVSSSRGPGAQRGHGSIAGCPRNGRRQDLRAIAWRQPGKGQMTASYREG